MMFIHALSENTAMLKIARNAGATVKREGSESEAYLELPPADFETHVSELVTEHLGEMDYQLRSRPSISGLSWRVRRKCARGAGRPPQIRRVSRFVKLATLQPNKDKRKQISK
jgi:hypothetical protein